MGKTFPNWNSNRISRPTKACSKTEGPYPLGDLGKIGAIIGTIIGLRRLIIAPETPWVWPKIAGQSPGNHQVTGDCRPISRMFDISLPTDRQATAVVRQSVAQG